MHDFLRHERADLGGQFGRGAFPESLDGFDEKGLAAWKRDRQGIVVR
jgi:hypothetical protein